MSVHLATGRISFLTLLWSQVVLAVLDSLHLYTLWPGARLNYLETGYHLCNTNRLPGSLCDLWLNHRPLQRLYMTGLKGRSWHFYTRRGTQQVWCLVFGHGLCLCGLPRSLYLSSLEGKQKLKRLLHIDSVPNTFPPIALPLLSSRYPALYCIFLGCLSIETILHTCPDLPGCQPELYLGGNEQAHWGQPPFLGYSLLILP